MKKFYIITFRVAHLDNLDASFSCFSMQEEDGFERTDGKFLVFTI